MQKRTVTARLMTAAALASLLTAGLATAQPPVAQTAQAAPATDASPNDASITSRVKAALQSDKQLAAVPVNVSTSGGVVVLAGSVPSPDVGARVVQLAAAVPGVKDVKNELKLPG